jgi:hypothetical protein
VDHSDLPRNYRGLRLAHEGFMTAPTDPATVAGKLTKAQREAVLALNGDAYKQWPDERLRAMMDGLGRSGLSQMRDLGIAEKGPPWHLTTLGLAVRAHLLSDAGEGGGR